MGNQGGGGGKARRSGGSAKHSWAVGQRGKDTHCTPGWAPPGTKGGRSKWPEGNNLVVKVAYSTEKCDSARCFVSGEAGEGGGKKIAIQEKIKTGKENERNV